MDSSQREPDRPPSFHLVNRLLFQLYRYFKEIIISQHQIAAYKPHQRRVCIEQKLSIYAVHRKGVVCLLLLQTHVTNRA